MIVPEEPRGEINAEARPIGAVGVAPYARAVAPTVALAPTRFPFVATPLRLALVDAGCVLVLWLVFSFLVLCSGLGFLLSEHWSALGPFSVNVLLGGVSLLIVYGMVRFRRQSAETIGLGRPDAARFTLGTLLAVPIAYAASAMANLLYMQLSGQGVDEFLNERSALFDIIPTLPFGSVVLFSLFVGFHEEVFFRGFLLSRLTVGLRSRAAAVVVTSVIFGLLHAYQGPAGMLQTAALGAVLGATVCATRTLWPAILAHAFFNIVGLVLMPWLSEMLEELQAAPPV